MEEKRPRKGEGEKEAVGGEQLDPLEGLQRRKWRFDSALTISGTEEAEVLNRRSGEWPGPTLTWAFSRRRSVQMGSTTASRPDTSS